MNSIRLIPITAVVCTVLLSFGVSAQSIPASVMEPYQRHVQAIDAGDYETARMEGIVAFEAGEAAGIDASSLARLARNVADISVALQDFEDAGDWYRSAAEVAEDAGNYAEMLDILYAATASFLNGGDVETSNRFARGAASAFERLEESGLEISGENARQAYESNAVASNAAVQRLRNRQAREYADAAIEIVDRYGLEPDLLYSNLSRTAGLMATLRGERASAYRSFLAAQAIRARLQPEEEATRELRAWVMYASVFLDRDDREDIRASLRNLGILPDNEDCEGESCSDEAEQPSWCPSGEAVDTVPDGDRRPPEYPRRAAEAGAGGFALVEFRVNSQGQTRDVEVLATAPGRIFVGPSERAVNRWRYVPATCDGEAVDRSQVVTFFNYRMEDTGADDPEAWRLRRN